MTAREPLTESRPEGAGIGAEIEHAAQRLKDVRQGIESLADPFGMVAPLAHAQVLSPRPWVPPKGVTLPDTLKKGVSYVGGVPDTGQFILANGQPGLSSTLGAEGVLTAYYGNPRQVYLTVGLNFR